MVHMRRDAAMRNLFAAAVLAPVVLLTGCSDGTNFLNPQTPTGSAEGTVYDGYLAGALVCADENLNRTCDVAEPSVLTDANGDFVLDGLTDRQLEVPLVVEVVAGTIDLDTGAAPPAGLKFTAPAGSTVISAYTMIIQARIEAEIAAAIAGSLPVPTLDSLKASVTAALATELGVTGVDLTTYDPIAAKNDTTLTQTERRTAAELHITNQILSAQIADLVPQAETLVPGEEAPAFAAVINKLDPADVLAAVETDLLAVALIDLLTQDPATVTSETPPVLPTITEINDQAAVDADVAAAIEAQLPEPEPTGATGGA